MALLWLSIAVAICFIYGKTLLKWTMVPHDYAIRGAMRDRSITILEEKGRELKGFTVDLSVVLGRDAEAGAEPASAWDQLFAGEIRRARLSGSLREFARSGILPLLEGKVDAAKLDELAEGFAAAIESSLGNEPASLSARSLPERFAFLEEELRRTAARLGQLPIKRLLGVGKSLDPAIASLAEFNHFLAARKKALEESPPPPPRTRAGVSALERKLELVHAEMQKRSLQLAEDEGKPPIAISYPESFMSYFKVALVFGLFFSTPLILYEMWKFVGAGLYPNEQRYVLIFLPFSIGLFFGGALFGYFSVIPVALEFLAGWGADLVELNFTISNYVGLFFTLTIILGLTFQTPLVMIFLSKIGAVGAEGFRSARKWAIMASVIFAAIVTPPDPLSWSLVAGPMILLYELGILIVSAASRKKATPSPGKSVGKPQGVV